MTGNILAKLSISYLCSILWTIIWFDTLLPSESESELESAVTHIAVEIIKYNLFKIKLEYRLPVFVTIRSYAPSTNGVTSITH